MTRPDGGAATAARTHRRAAADAAMTQPITGGPVVDDGPVRPRETVVEAVRRDATFRELRSRQRRFVLTVTPLFLAWYGLFVGLSAFAPSLMRVPVLGAVNLGMLLGLAQFATTLAIVAAYRRFARREIDPRVHALRAVHEPGGAAVAEAHTEIRRLR